MQYGNHKSLKEYVSHSRYILQPDIEELVDMLGFLEDGQWINYGLTEEEDINPTKETVEKIKKYLEKEENNYKTK